MFTAKNGTDVWLIRLWKQVDVEECAVLVPFLIILASGLALGIVFSAVLFKRKFMGGKIAGNDVFLPLRSPMACLLRNRNRSGYGIQQLPKWSTFALRPFSTVTTNENRRTIIHRKADLIHLFQVYIDSSFLRNHRAINRDQLDVHSDWIIFFVSSTSSLVPIRLLEIFILFLAFVQFIE